MLQQSVMEVILPGKESSGKSRKRVKKNEMIGKVEIPQEALLAALQIGED